MNNDDKYLAEKFGKENHFRVPDGYFDHFSDRLMEKVMEQTAENGVVTPYETECSDARQTDVKLVPIRSQRRRWRWAVAAVFTGLIVSTAAWHEISRTSSRDSVRQEEPANMSTSHIASNDATTSYFSNTDMQEMVDYTMLDNEDMYAYIADN